MSNDSYNDNISAAEQQHEEEEEEEIHSNGEGFGRVYEAYNELHGLARDLDAGFDSPAVLVVGHQTNGKSALVEALMGFQFNHVGGGTKTRRPITLHMRYSPQRSQPFCRLLVDGTDRHASLQEIQAYIEAENMRLENEPNQFSDKEVIIKIDYKYCPNLTIIDTPGLIAPAPGRKNRVLEAQAHAVETLIRAKMQHKEFIILCLEDCNDWSNATTRSIVMQIDPELSRTVVVSTKLDTKIPQFARASDVEVFLKPPSCTLEGYLLGGSPFFTSVPSGRVGSGRDSVFKSNEEFKKAILTRQLEDITCLEEKLGRLLSKDERSRIGVSSLRLFLEELLRKRYLETVPLIIPVLEKEHRSTTRKLRDINQEISNLDEAKLKEKARVFHDSFLTKVSLLLKGTVVAPPDKFGETLQDERTSGGAFVGCAGFQHPQKTIPNAGMRLYGGAQYHRAMAEFRLVVGNVKCPPITREEIVNACGVEDIHDGTNYARSACVIAVAKARDTFEPFLHQLGARLLYILKRLLPISVYLLQKDGEYLSGHEVFLRRVEVAYISFAESTERACRDKCMEDLTSTTRYVSWSLHNKVDINFFYGQCVIQIHKPQQIVMTSSQNRAGLRQFLDSFASSDQSSINTQDFPFSLSVNDHKNDGRVKSDLTQNHFTQPVNSNSFNHTAETRLVDLLDSTLWNRRLAPSSERIVYALVHQIFHGIKEHFLVTTELKYNCFLLMPVVDKLPALLREDLVSASKNDFDSIFDITRLQHSLSQQKCNLEIDLKRIQRLKEKFKEIREQLSSCQLLDREFQLDCHAAN